VGLYALLIAAGEYEDPTLSRLRAPEQDVERLAALLDDPDVGGFTEVRVLRDAPDHQVRLSIEDLLSDRLRDDLVLLYFSCHGVVDRQGKLYFAAANTRQNRPAGTATSASFVNELIAASLASAKILILDCCYSGAFAEGFKSIRGNALDGRIGTGYVVLSASDRYEFAFEGDSVTDSAPRASAFTDVMIEGLSTGAADLNGDGRIDVDELFRYVHEGVVRRQPNQTPRKWASGADPHIVVARARTRPAGDDVRSEAPATARGKAGGPASGMTTRANNFNRRQVLVVRGMRSSADMIRRTLGPLGRRILFEDASGLLLEGADARTIVGRYSPDDPRDRLGASYIAELVTSVHDQCGAGGATVVVLAQAMVDAAAAALRDGASPIALSRGVDAGVTMAREALARLAHHLRTKEQLAATIALAAKSAEFGELLAEAMDKVGVNGVITVEASNTMGLELELTEGTSFDRGYISPYFLTDADRSEAVLEDPYILLYTGRITTVAPLLPLLEKVMQTGKPLLVVAEDVEGEALATLVVNKIRDTFKSAAVKAPGFGDRRRAMLDDIAAITGATLVESDSSGGLADVTVEMLGRARQVVITTSSTTIVDGAGSAEEIVARVHQIRAEIERSDSDWDRDKLSERLGKIAGGVAVIKVGALTEEAMQTRMDDIRRALRYARLVVAEGVVAGGGFALRSIAPTLTAAVDESDRCRGIGIVASALPAASVQLLSNAEVFELPEGYTGYDVVREIPVDMVVAGLTDSAGTLRVCIEAAAQLTQRFLMTA
jgi:chaperonin GroEL